MRAKKQKDRSLLEPGVIGATINALNASVAILDRAGTIVAVNDKWRNFGRCRGARSDYLGMNYIAVCAGAAERGDRSAKRVVAGLRRMLDGEAETFGIAYVCAERTFRMRVRHLGDPANGIIVAHEDITLLLEAARQQHLARQTPSESERARIARSNRAYEELGQRLAAISLAARAIEEGGDLADSLAIIHLAVSEARHELRTFYKGRALPLVH